MDPFCYLCVMSVILSCLFCATLLPPAGRPLGTLVCDFFLVLCHFSIWCPGSGVVFECINS